MNKVLSAQQASTSLGVSLWMIPRWGRIGHLASILLGRRWLFSDEDRHVLVQEGIASTHGVDCHRGASLNWTDGEIGGCPVVEENLSGLSLLRGFS
jgi:hypothetical protein